MQLITQECHPQINVICENVQQKVVQLNVELQTDWKTLQGGQQTANADHHHFGVRGQLDVGLTGVQKGQDGGNSEENVQS